MKDCVYVVKGKNDGTMLGPFDTEELAEEWAKNIYWVSGYSIHRVHKIHSKPH